MSGAFESILLSPSLSKNKMFMETGFLVNGGHDGYNNSATVVSDGATSNRAQIQGPFDAVNNPRGWVAGAAMLTDRGPVPVPSASSTAEIFSMSSSITALASATAWSYGMAWSGNDLVIRCNGATPATDFRTLTFTGLRTTYSGRTIMVESVATTDTADPVLRVNETILAGTPATGGGTTPNWLSASMVPTYHVGSYLYPAGITPLTVKILGSLTDADRAFHRSTGQYPAWVVAGGSAAALYSSNFSAGTDSWYAQSGVVAGNIDSIGGVDNVLRLTASTGGEARRDTFTFAAGTELFFEVDVFIPNTNSTGYLFQLTGESNQVTTFNKTPATSTWVSYRERVTFTAGAASGIRLRLLTVGYTTPANGDLVYFKNIRLYKAGALSLPGIQQCAVVDDLTTIGDNCALLVGMTPVPNRNVERIANYTITSGNEQLMGGSVFRGTSQDFIKSWTIINLGGTTTVSLGNISGGAQYASAVSCPTGTTVITLLSNVPLTTNLWCNANTTAKLLHVIEAYRTV